MAEDDDQPELLPTAEIDLLFWTNKKDPQYLAHAKDGGFEFRVYDSDWSPANWDIPGDATQQRLEAQDKGWAAKILANMGQEAKDRLKRLIAHNPDKYETKKFQRDILTQYFREYRGDCYRTRLTDIEYHTPDWEGRGENSIEVEPYYQGPRPTDPPPPEPEPEPTQEQLDAWDIYDDEYMALENDEERAAYKERRRREEVEHQLENARRRAVRAAQKAVQEAEELRQKEAKEERRREWLASNKTSDWWEEPLAGPDSKWVGQKVLGEGGNGIAGLWKYEDPGHPDDGKLVVVKQVRSHAQGNFSNSQLDELVFLRRLKETGAEHVTKLVYDSLPDPKGKPGYIPRIFLEYLPGGDLHDFMKRQSYKQEKVTERTAWEIFLCLMKGTAAMNTGTEDPTDKDGDTYIREIRQYYNHNPNKPKELGEWRPITHHDLKPMNIFIGFRDEDEHKTTRIFKIADFGLAMQYKGSFGYPNNKYVKRGHRMAGTPGWYVPEQFTERWEYPEWERDQVSGMYNPSSNVWAIGAIMYNLLLLSKPEIIGYRSQLTAKLAKNITYGKALEFDDFYSLELRTLILECMVEKPKERPKEYVILKKIKAALETCPPHVPGEAGEQYDAGGPGEDPVAPPVQPAAETQIVSLAQAVPSTPQASQALQITQGGDGGDGGGQEVAIVRSGVGQEVAIVRSGVGQEVAVIESGDDQSSRRPRGSNFDAGAFFPTGRQSGEQQPRREGGDLDIDFPLVGAAAPASIREAIRRRSPANQPKPNRRKRHASAMAPDETFAEYLSRPDGTGQDFVGEYRWPELGQGRAKRVRWTEDIDENTRRSAREAHFESQQHMPSSDCDCGRDMALNDIRDLGERRRVGELKSLLGWLPSVSEGLNALRRAGGDVRRAAEEIEANWE